MNILVTPDRLINLEQIAYVHRESESPTIIRIYFAAPATSSQGVGGLELELRGADADLLINRMTRKTNEEPGMP